MNKYEKWYYSITDRAKLRQYDGSYKEFHHIVPRCLGGTEEPSNFAHLTAREHFICHWLLVKMYPTGQEHWKLLNALRMMRSETPSQTRYDTKITARVYENLKEKYSKLSSERVSGEKNPMHGDKFYRSPEGRERQRLAVTGEKNGAKQPEARAKISKSSLGRKHPPRSAEYRAKCSATSLGENNGMFGKKHSDGTKALIAERAKGRKQNPEDVAKRSATLKSLNLKRERKICPHCDRSIAVNMYAAWHGDKCKLKETVIA